MPKYVRQLMAMFLIRMLQGRYEKFQLKKPVVKPLQVHPTINSELLYFISHGKILPRDGIERFEDDTVYFTDGKKEVFDTIIFATGYKVSFPFFEKDFIDYSTLTTIPLYRKMFHPDIDTLYFIGLFQPQGCIWPLADYQSKIIAGIIKGNLKRPTDLYAKIAKETKKTRSRYKGNVGHAIEVDYHEFRKQLITELKTLGR